MQNGRMKVVDGHWIDYRLVAEFVGFTITGTPFHASTGQPYQKPVGGVVPSLTAFRNWHAAKFATLNDQLVIDGSGF